MLLRSLFPDLPETTAEGLVEGAAGIPHHLVELARHHELESADILSGVNGHRNTPAIVGNGDNIAFVQSHADRRAMTGKGLSNAGVNDVIYEMMKPVGACGANVHARSWLW